MSTVRLCTDVAWNFLPDLYQSGALFSGADFEHLRERYDKFGTLTKFGNLTTLQTEAVNRLIDVVDVEKLDTPGRKEFLN